MIIALIYIFLSYVMFDQHLKITLRKSSVPSEKVRLLFFTLFHAFPTTFLINQLATVTPSPFSALQFPF